MVAVVEAEEEDLKTSDSSGGTYELFTNVDDGDDDVYDEVRGGRNGWYVDIVNALANNDEEGRPSPLLLPPSNQHNNDIAVSSSRN